MGQVIAVNISEEKGVPKHPVDKGYFEVNHGLVGDAHAGNWHRQVSLLAAESIEKTKLVDKKGECIGMFAENLTTKGLILHEMPVGTRLKIGETIMEVTQIGKECHHGCAIKEIVGDCIMPREGIFTKVITPGWIRTGDNIEICE
jgi:MOSC domain-containing protein YiiM